MDAPRTDPFPEAALAAPFRLIVATTLVATACVQLIDYLSGDYLRGAVIGVVMLVGFFAWREAARGRMERAAIVIFHTAAFSLVVRLWLGYGLRDFAIAGFPALLFLGCVFLSARGYWLLAAIIIGGTLFVGFAELAGLRPGGRDATVRAGSFANLIVVLSATAIGGRALVHAVRDSLRRERALRDSLRWTQERLEKIVRSSQNAIVVSRPADGVILEANDAYLKMFGQSREGILRHTAFDLALWEEPRERERFVRAARERLGVRGFEARLRRKSGETLEAMLSAEVLETGSEEWLVVSVADVTAQRASERRAEHLATRDPLTGLPNRALALDRLQRGLARARRAGTAIGILHIGLDRFKAINESLGRMTGDDVLREACVRIGIALGASDTLARLSGDELLVIADPMHEEDGAAGVAERVMAAFVAPFAIGARTVVVSCSVGTSGFPRDSADADMLLRYADIAMHEAKDDGRGRHRAFDRAMDRRAHDRLLVESGLRPAMARGELRLAYQPKFDLATRAVTGLEALVRWNHPQLGELAPARFIPIAEESDLMLELGGWILHQACAQVARWEAAGRQPVPVAVNLSVRQLHSGLPALVAECVRDAGIDISLVELEVTESMLITNPDSTRRVLQQLSAQGARIVLDDFGVGYSSLGYVKLLPLDGIKIDRSFVSDVATDRHDAAIVDAIVGLARGLGLRVIAEGVEEPAQLEALRAAGCDEGQGFLLYRPVDAAEIGEHILAARSPAVSTAA